MCKLGFAASASSVCQTPSEDHDDLYHKQLSSFLALLHCRATFYTPGLEGYTDYPFLDEQQVAVL
jgi:hypothetical protein